MSLRDEIDLRWREQRRFLEERDRRYAAERTADQHANRLAREQLGKRLDGMNEWRLQAQQERDTFMDKQEYQLRHAPLEERLTALEQWRANITGRAAALSLIGAAFSAAMGAGLVRLLG